MFSIQPMPFPEMRRDPVSGRWVIVATDRASRPGADLFGESSLPLARCPFCEGHEADTTSEVLVCRRPDTEANQAGWNVRVIPNRYSAVRFSGEHIVWNHGLFEGLSAIGSHDVVIECPQHESSLALVSAENFAAVVRIWRDRLRQLRTEARWAYAMVFKNMGSRAGASVEHSHSQILATTVIPGSVEEEMNRCSTWFQQHRECLFCNLMKMEMQSDRHILSTSSMLAFAPYASRWPFETWIVPTRHHSHFEEIGDEECLGLAASLQEILKRLHHGLKDPPYNLVLHTAPFTLGNVPDYHWHVEILPRLTQPAGYEWGTGCHINPIPPEQAAAFLRRIPQG